MLQSFIGLFVRHALTTGGGALIAKGILTAAEWDTVTGAVLALLGVAFSVAHKYRRGMK